MAWEIYGRPYYNTSEMSDTTVKQEVVFDGYNPILKAVRVELILHGNPVFTSLNMKIYSSTLVLLHTSSPRLSADLIADDYTIVETYFEFANVNLVKGETYYFVINATGYSGASGASHIAWKNTYPDPFYGSGSANTKVELNRYPLTILLITSRFDTP